MKNEIDLVYLWVDGSDPEWLARKRATTGDFQPNSETDDVARWLSNDELKYSFRSMEKFAPWVRKVFIVTDRQVPSWLDTANERVRVVDHSEIFPPEALPCFNSSVIEYFLHRIPGLAPRFLFANDDMFFGQAVGPEFFFGEDGWPVLRLKRKLFGKLRYAVKRALKMGFGHYRRMVYRSACLVEEISGRFFSGIPHHNIDAYVRDDYARAVEQIFADEVCKSQVNRTRADGDFHRSAIGLWALAIGHAHMHYVASRSESFRIPVHKPDFMGLYRRFRPKLFCLNDSQHSSADDRRRIVPFLEELFPEKSSFEL